MFSAAVRTAGVTVFAAAAVAYVFAPGAGRRVLDPNDPIAADGSMTAGRAATIYDTNPLLRASKEPHATSDDPADFEPLIRLDRGWAVTDRALFKGLLGRLDWSLCKGGKRQMLLLAVRTYYSMRGREKYVFSLRGPRATAAIEHEWSTPADREIDDYVGHAVQYGILHKSDVPKDPYAEFVKTFADVKELGAGCTAADIR